MHLKTLTTLTATFLLAPVLVACVDTTPESIAQANANTDSATPKNHQDKQFIRKLIRLNRKDPVADAEATIQSGKRHFLCNVGRSRTVPGLTPETYSAVSNNCPTKCLDGVSDAIYGRNHAKYLSAAIAYSASWNQVMINVCKS